jgi:putative ATP-dependent endonuclease of the OLD family
VELIRLRVCGFRCVGAEPVELTFDKLTFLLGPNGTGKTAFLHALVRLFGSEASLRRIVPGDFHVPYGESPGVGARSFWLEADFAFPELVESEQPQPTVPPHFAHMRMGTVDERPTVRFRLTADLDESGDITGELAYVLAVDADGEPTRKATVNRFDRAAIQVHYLPARRNPADHVSYAANTLLGRLLRAADWKMEQTTVTGLSKEISDALAANAAVASVASHLTTQWRSLHTGAFFTNPGLSFTRSEIEAVLRYVTLEFTPGPGQPAVDFSLLSDGQQSLLYIALVLTAQDLGRKALAGQIAAFDLDRLRPAVFTLLAVEEPENSLSPHYLGRVLAALARMANGYDAQAVVATHSASLMRRVEPEQVRYLRLNTQRRTTVSMVAMPATADEAHKFVREALHAYPELYFARLIVLGEGDSEEIVLPRCLRVVDLDVDATSISVVPLGGRHVNHFWRLLQGLGIPHVTLLDLDLGRYQGGWGRIKYAAGELLRFSPPGNINLTQANVDDLGNRTSDVRAVDGMTWLSRLEMYGVFFSNPLDLDFTMLQQFGDAYDINTEELAPPTDDVIAAVLGKTGDAALYTDDEKLLFSAYHRRFKLSSKPARHIAALAKLTDSAVREAMPEPLRRLTTRVATTLSELPE